MFKSHRLVNMAEQQHQCVICKQSNVRIGKTTDESADGVRIGQVGAKGINTKANGRGENIVAKEGDIVHKDCRKRYSNGKYVVRVEKGSSSANISPPAATRPSTPSFTCEDNCF